MKTTNAAEKFTAMTAEQYAALKAGDEVTSKSGRLYRCNGRCGHDAATGKPLQAGQQGVPEFRQVRNGKLYGPAWVRIKRESVAAPVAPAIDIAALRAELGLDSAQYSDDRVIELAARCQVDAGRSLVGNRYPR